jgi:hypothetical protein
MANVSDSKVQSVTGHKSLEMTDRYTHFNAKEFVEVRDVQENLFKVEVISETAGLADPGQDAAA